VNLRVEGSGDIAEGKGEGEGEEQGEGEGEGGREGKGYWTAPCISLLDAGITFSDNSW